MGTPEASVTLPTKFPVLGLNALMVPAVLLLPTSKVLLNGPKFAGAMANPQGWLNAELWVSCFTNVPSSIKMSTNPPG